MSARSLRARARAQQMDRALGQDWPAQPNIGAGVAENNLPQPNVGMTSNQKYTDSTHFISMLRQIGVTRSCIDQFIVDDFDTMGAIVLQYKGDITAFETYLKTINITMNTAENPVRFSPIVMDRLLAVTHYFIQAVTCFHTLPDIELINKEMAVNLIDSYRSYKQFSNDDMNEEILITLPELKGHDNWISYRDKFLHFSFF